MTLIDFYPNLHNPIATAAKLTAKAYAQYGAVRVVTDSAEDAAELSRRLWTEPPMSFIPHCFADSPLAAETPVVIGGAENGEEKVSAKVLVNLGLSIPPNFSRYERLAELFSDGELSLQKGRERWSAYKKQGYEIRAHVPKKRV
jgi:DNA polymerase-3 subunit chi